MLIYSNILRLADCDPQPVLEATTNWASRKLRRPLRIKDLLPESDIRTPSGLTAQTWSDDQGRPELFGFRLRHPDSRDRGISWTLELGFEASNPTQSTVSILLLKEELSTLVSAQTVLSRPNLVDELLARCSFAVDTPGLTVKSIDSVDAAEAFRLSVNDVTRVHPFVLVSPKSDGKLLLDQGELLRLLFGLAEVVVIRPEVGRQGLVKCLGTQVAVWDGAVNILYPRRATGLFEGVPTRRFLPKDFDLYRSFDKDPEKEILALVVDYANRRNRNLHISPEAIQSQLARRQLAVFRDEGASREKLLTMVQVLDGLLALSERHLRQSREEHDISMLARDIASIEAEEKSNDEKRQLEAKVRGLQQQLGRKTGKAPCLEDFPEEQAQTLRAVAERRSSLSQALEFLCLAYADRVVVLDSAWRSAREASAFTQSARALELVLKLATSYWELLVNGGGDTRAKEVFGEAFAAQESETVETNKRAHELRTFEYQGSPTYMPKHLKIGMKDSVARTWRLHFHWDAGRKVIVIGHCGKHLDHS